MIYGFHRGTEGVAIPTLVSRMTAAIIIIVLLCDEKRTLHIERTWRYRINWEMVKKILSIGVPNGLENSMFQLGKLAIQSTVSTLGTTAIAAQAMTNMLEMLNGTAVIGVGIGLMTVVGQSLGAEKKRRGSLLYEETDDLFRSLSHRLLCSGICPCTADYHDWWNGSQKR